jgi:predicted RND superfamily exporter protein
MIIVFGMQGWLGIEFDPMVITMPLYLGLAVAIGYSIHIFHYFKRKFYETGKRKQSIIYAIEETGWPILFTALTTITALLSFLFVPVRPLRWIGLTTAVIIGVEYLIVIVLIPSLLSFGKDKSAKFLEKKQQRKYLENFMEKISNWIFRHPKGIIITLIISVVLCIIGITKFEVSFDVERTMGRRIPYVNRILEIADSKIGSLYSYSVGIEFPNPGDAKNPENLKKFEKLINEVEKLPLTKKTSSLLDIIKDINQTLNEGKKEYNKVPDSREMIAQLLLLYENAGGTEAEKWVDYDYQRLHLMTEVSTYNSNEMVSELDFIKKRCQELFPGSKLMLIGSISQFTVMMDYVVKGQLKSFFIALVFITILLMLVFGNIKTGLIAMIPNVAPALAVGGVMGFSGIPLDMMTVTLMPMLLGLAVDDTIHFINHVQLEHLRTNDYKTSINRVFRTVCIALFLTSAVLVLNFSTYMISTSNMYKNMGILVSTGIFAALIADYFVTPVLLNYLRPFGRKEK